MKKLYIGLGISAALIIGGFSYSVYAKPKVDMANMGKLYYQSDLERNYNSYGVKVVSGDIQSLKVTITFKDFSGANSIRNIVQSLTYDYNAKADITDKDKKAVEEYFSSESTEIAKKLNPNWKKGDKLPQLQKEVIQYKWLEKPFNLIISETQYENPYNDKDIGKGYEIQKPILDNGEIPLSGSIKLSEHNNGEARAKLHGVRGSGVLELEFKSTYK